jgi:hypothetical protein
MIPNESSRSALNLRKEYTHGLRMFEDRELRGILGTWREEET